MKIQQGAQYYVKFIIKKGETVIDDSVDDVLIQIDNILKKKSLNEIIFVNNAWLFPVTSEQTQKWGNNVMAQVGYVENSNVYPSEVKRIDVTYSLIPFDKVVTDE